jgi:hypothetical protein
MALAAPDRVRLAEMSDEDLEAHIAFLQYWLQFDQETVAIAVRERDRRGRGGYVLTAEAEDYLDLFAQREAA